MEKKSIVVTVTNDLTYDQRMQKTCFFLVELNYDVLFVGRLLPNSVPLQKAPYNQKRIKCLFNKGFLFYAEFSIRLFFFLLFKRMHSLVAVDTDTLLACTLVRILKPATLLYHDAHEYFSEVPEVMNRPFVKYIWSKIAVFCMKYTYKCYTVGPVLASLFTDLYKKPFQVVRNAPGLKNTPLLDQEPVMSEPKIVLYQGALNQGRGIEAMIHAMKLLVNKPIVFHIIGEGPIKQQLVDLVINLNLENKIFFLGFIKPSELSDFTRKAFVGLNVSEPNGLSYYYSLNNKFFDYIHAELPSLINKFPEYEKINTLINVGILCDSNPLDLANQIILLLENNSLYNTLKMNCKKAKLMYNWDTEKQTLHKIYA